MRNVSQSLRRWTLDGGHTSGGVGTEVTELDGGRTSAGVGTEVTELGLLPILFTSDY